MQLSIYFPWSLCMASALFHYAGILINSREIPSLLNCHYQYLMKLWMVSVSHQAFWKDKGLSGEIVTGPSTDCPFSVTFDATSPNGNAALVGFIAGQQASLWSSKEVKGCQWANTVIYISLCASMPNLFLFRI